MSKFGWDLPPGCRDSDIPGNRPEDMADEQIRDNIEDALKPLGLPNELTDEDQEKVEQVIENLFKLINNAHESGYAQAVSDADEARSYAALEHADDRQEENERRTQSESTAEACQRMIQQHENNETN
jgi:hypothetical protein